MKLDWWWEPRKTWKLNVSVCVGVFVWLRAHTHTHTYTHQVLNSRTQDISCLMLSEDRIRGLHYMWEGIQRTGHMLHAACYWNTWSDMETKRTRVITTIWTIASLFKIKCNVLLLKKKDIKWGVPNSFLQFPQYRTNLCAAPGARKYLTVRFYVWDSSVPRCHT